MPVNERPAEHTGHDDLALAGAIARLSVEFADDVPAPIVSRVVVRSRRDLSGVPAPALPELVERLARERLIQSAVAVSAAHSRATTRSPGQ